MPKQNRLKTWANNLMELLQNKKKSTKKLKLLCKKSKQRLILQNLKSTGLSEFLRRETMKLFICLLKRR